MLDKTYKDWLIKLKRTICSTTWQQPVVKLAKSENDETNQQFVDQFGQQVVSQISFGYNRLIFSK